MRLRIARDVDAADLSQLTGAPAIRLATLHVVLAEDREGTAGVMALGPGGRLDPVWTAAGDRGRTAATALYDAIEAEARRGGLARLSTTAGSDLAAFLARRGWTETGEGASGPEMERQMAPPA